VLFFSLQLQQALRENLSIENETIARLKDDLAAANRRQTNGEDELANLRTIMHGLDNDLLAKTMSLDQTVRVGRLSTSSFFNSAHAPTELVEDIVNPLECRGNYSATSKDMELVHLPLMGGLLHLVQRGEDWAGPHRIAV